MYIFTKKCGAGGPKRSPCLKCNNPTILNAAIQHKTGCSHGLLWDISEVMSDQGASCLRLSLARKRTRKSINSPMVSKLHPMNNLTYWRKKEIKIFIEDTYVTKSALQKGPPAKLQIIKLIQKMLNILGN